MSVTMYESFFASKWQQFCEPSKAAKYKNKWKNFPHCTYKSINQSINTESAYTETWPALYK